MCAIKFKEDYRGHGFFKKRPFLGKITPVFYLLSPFGEITNISAKLIFFLTDIYTSWLATNLSQRVSKQKSSRQQGLQQGRTSVIVSNLSLNLEPLVRLPWSAAVTSVLMTTEHTLWQTGMLVVVFYFLAKKNLEKWWLQVTVCTPVIAKWNQP